MNEPMHPLQAMLDGMSARWQKDRAESQMTLGELIAWLESKDPADRVLGLGSLDSYRGYYSDLAFAPNGDRTVGDLLAECRGAMGKVFRGYKGGDFLMGENTPLWISHYGVSSAPRLMRMTEAAPYAPVGEVES